MDINLFYIATLLSIYKEKGGNLKCGLVLQFTHLF